MAGWKRKTLIRFISTPAIFMRGFLRRMKIFGFLCNASFILFLAGACNASIRWCSSSEARILLGSSGLWICGYLCVQLTLTALAPGVPFSRNNGGCFSFRCIHIIRIYCISQCIFIIRISYTNSPAVRIPVCISSDVILRQRGS